MTDDYTPLTDNSVEARLLDIEALLDHLTREQGESARTSMRHHARLVARESLNEEVPPAR